VQLYGEAAHGEAGKQAAVLANHFIFPVNTCTDATIHCLTLVGGPTDGTKRAGFLLLP
jgi:hypothetical protein